MFVMKRRVPAGRVAVVIALALLAARPAHAQVNPRPYTGIFAPHSDRDKHFDVMWSLAGAYDDNVTADQLGGNPYTQLGGTFGVAQSSVTFQNKGEHKLFSATGNVVGRYYTAMELLNAV